MIQYDPSLPRVGCGFAAMIMSAVNFGLMVVLPSTLEQDNSVLPLRGDAHHTASDAHPADVMQIRCTVPAAINVPLFSAVRVNEPDPDCKQQS